MTSREILLTQLKLVIIPKYKVFILQELKKYFMNMDIMKFLFINNI